MWKQLKKVILDLVTEPDNDIICPLRIMGVLGFLWALVMNGWSVIVLKVAFDLSAFGICYGSMLAALGAALKLKTNSRGTSNEHPN